MAKLITSELGKRVVDACLQCFGGYGYMEEYPISRMYRDARAATIAGGTSEIMKEIIAKIMIDEVRYEPAYGKTGEREGEVAPAPATVAELMRTLPGRLRPEKIGSWETVFHFDLSGPAGGKFTVTILDGACAVEDGLQGEAKCLIQAEDRLYMDIELGRADPQAAFMTGGVKVSDLGEMMHFGRAFRRWGK